MLARKILRRNNFCVVIMLGFRVKSRVLTMLLTDISTTDGISK